MMDQAAQDGVGEERSLRTPRSEGRGAVEYCTPSTDDLDLRGRLAKVDDFHGAGKPSALATDSAPPVLPKR